ncbi:MAG: winged helix DNA-binding domain-containing protein [Aureispira sp.]|nr:winged helix DNA-binding domain-containing protein [Aureispira sp.]
MKIDVNQARWFRFCQSGLNQPFESSEACATQLLGVQAQILNAGAIALWNRLEEFSLSDFQDLLYTQKTLVKLWGQRKTIHLYTTQDWPTIHKAFVDTPSWWKRKIKDPKELAAFDKALDSVVKLLKKEKTLNRALVRDSKLKIPEALTSSWGGLFMDLVFHGHACHGQRKGNQGCFVHREHWVPNLEWTPPTELAAKQWLAQQYFQTYGPATIHDFAYWAGGKVTVMREVVKSLGDKLVEVNYGAQAHWIWHTMATELQKNAPSNAQWPTRLLYRFDPLLLPHKDKSWLIEEQYYKSVWKKAAVIDAVILIAGQIKGTWKYTRKGKRLLIELMPFKPLSKGILQKLEKEAFRIASFLEYPKEQVIVSVL